MYEANSDILADIDATLHQLTENARALKKAHIHSKNFEIIQALKKTQESLLARLMHRQSILDQTKKKIVLDSFRKKSIENKAVEYAKSLQFRGVRRKIQNRDNSRSSRSKS